MIEPSVASEKTETYSGPMHIAVDLDNTLVTTDLLHEGIVSALKINPLLIFLLPFWLLRGKAYFKREIMKRATVDVQTLPVNVGLLSWLNAQKIDGRKIHLVSGSDQGIVDSVASRFYPLFDSALGSDGVVNNTGASKLETIRSIAGNNCVYVGDSKVDLEIWNGLGSAALAGSGIKLKSRLSDDVKVVAEFPVKRIDAKILLKALRVHQWAKNLLMFLPLFLSGGVYNVDKLCYVFGGFIVFGLIASGSYLLNDLFDITSDRMHRSKKNRPLASGDLSIKRAVLLISFISIMCALVVPLFGFDFLLTAVSYLIITISYSFFVKTKAIIDILTLALLFTLRIVAGIALSETEMSPWLLAFSMFFFLSLAGIKRYSECYVLSSQGLTSAKGRGYRVEDAPWLMSMGAASGFCAMLIFFIFLTDGNSPMSKYPNPMWLWAICGVLGYWLSRAWLKAGRGEMNDDPVLFAVKDPLSIVLGLVCAAVVLLARYA